jgi:Fe-S cluster assembly ATP-binding protein
MNQVKKNELLKITNLNISINKTKIINNLNLNIKKNELHVLMGPNGSGKSTLVKGLVGHPSYTISADYLKFKNKNLLTMLPEKRANEGLFLAFQNPLEIPGVSNFEFLRLMYNQKQQYLNKKNLTPLEFTKIINKFLKILKIKSNFLNRNVNEGFSGGEKKQNEILQLLILKPKLIILDEIDSGLDIDVIQIIFIKILKKLLKNSSLILITHNLKILNYCKPNYIHILNNGKIIKTGNLEILKILEKTGYKNFN